MLILFAVGTSRIHDCMSFNQTSYCQLLLKIKMLISGQKFDTRSSLRGSRTLWGWLCGRVELVMPLQPFHSNLTYAVLCTITSFEALIKGMSSNRARKQEKKQMNKWFCSYPSLMFTSCSSRPLRLLTSHSHLLISFSSQPRPPHPPPPSPFPSCVWQNKLFPSKECHRKLLDCSLCALETDQYNGLAGIIGLFQLQYIKFIGYKSFISKLKESVSKIYAYITITLKYWPF